MGTSGESILADDDAHEIYDHYRRQFLQGKDAAEVMEAITKKTRFMGCWQEVVTDLEHYYGLSS